MVVTLVETSEVDAGRIVEISKRAFDTGFDNVGPNSDRPLGYDSEAFYIKSLHFLDCYNILLGEEVVGGVMAKVGGRHGVLDRIFIDPDHQRRGIGSAAMGLAMERYPEVTFWTLGVPEGDTRTKQFFEKLGFRQVGWSYGDSAYRECWYERRIGESDVFSPIAALRDGMSNVIIEGKVTEKSFPRQVRSKRTGGSLTVANAAIEDASGRIVMVLWDKQFELVKVGGNIRVEDGYVNSYNGVTQLNVGYGRLIILI